MFLARNPSLSVPAFCECLSLSLFVCLSVLICFGCVLYFLNCCDGGGCACGYSFRLLHWFRVWSSDAGCRPLSSARACFWFHFILNAFSAVFCCSPHVIFSLFLMLLSLALCVPRFERSRPLLFMRVFSCRLLSMLLYVKAKNTVC